jgi:hypothetical protein
MSWLSKIWNSFFNYVPKQEVPGIKLNFDDYWVINVKKVDITAFIREMSILFPDDSVIYIEGTSIDPAIKKYLQAHNAEKITRVEVGTLWPRPTVFHISLSEEHLQKLAEFTDNYALPEICDHLIVYKGEEVLLEGYDFFAQDINLSGKIDENKVRVFCEKVGCTFKREHD